jgi:beta-mannosidase
MGTSWETHHGLGAWESEATAWLCTTTIEHYFGPSDSLEDLVSRSGWLQSEGYRSIFEEARRQQPRCSMALNWCFNEPWPCAANNSIINWPARPKQAYESVKAACRPVLASARIPHFQWRAGELFTAGLWLLNDTALEQPAGELRAELVFGGRRHRLLDWTFPALSAQSNLEGPKVQMAIPGVSDADFFLVLTVMPNEAWSSSYRLSLRSPRLPAGDTATP